MLVDTFNHEHFSKGARPDVAIIRGAADNLHYLLLEVKCVSPLGSRPELVGEPGTYAGFGNTSAEYRKKIVGCQAVGNRPAVPHAYPDAHSKGHTITPCIFEVFGGLDRDVVKLLNDWSAKARGKTPPELEPPWCARNYTPYWTQLLSKAVQRGAAEEILARVTEEGTAREAANSGRA